MIGEFGGRSAGRFLVSGDECSLIDNEFGGGESDGLVFGVIEEVEYG